MMPESHIIVDVIFVNNLKKMFGPVVKALGWKPGEREF